VAAWLYHAESAWRLRRPAASRAVRVRPKVRGYTTSTEHLIR